MGGTLASPHVLLPAGPCVGRVGRLVLIWLNSAARKNRSPSLGWLPVCGWALSPLPAPAAPVWEGDGSLSLWDRGFPGEVCFLWQHSLTSSLSPLVILGLGENIGPDQGLPSLGRCCSGPSCPCFPSLPILLGRGGESQPWWERAGWP